MRYLIIIATLFSFFACSSRNTPTPKEEGPGSVITGRAQQGISLSDIAGLGSDNDGLGLPINALLWRASLDILSTIPLDDVDTFGGSIVTEWYAPDDQPYRRLKLAVFVVGLELRSDAIQVRAYVQIKSADNEEWITAGRDEELGRKLEDLILARAREMRAATISESNK